VSAVASAPSAIFVPRRVRDVPAERRRAMFADPESTRLERWGAREWALCARPTLDGLRFFVEAYGSIEPPTGGPVPFDLWPAQVDVLARLVDGSLTILVVLKSRRLGLSWLALHYAVWLAAFAPFGPSATIVIICKNEDDAKALLGRAHRIIDRLPTWLRPTLATDSTEELALHETGSRLRSLPGTANAARLETATLLLLDEFAFPKNRAARGIWTAALPTIEGGGRCIAISTGNGEQGDGEQFAALVRQAQRGELPGGELVFLPWHARPDRTAEWREAERTKYLRVEDFEAEYPETVDQALAGEAEPTVYQRSTIEAALALGAVLDHRLSECLVDGVELGIDWGDFQTFGVYAAPLPAGGVFVLDELVQMRQEPVVASRNMLDHLPAGLAPWVRSVSADSAPPGNNRTLGGMLRDLAREQPNSFPSEVVTWQFGVIKEGGQQGRRDGVNTIGYITWLLNRSLDVWQRIADLPPELAADAAMQAPGVLAISPRCLVLPHQLRELRRDPDTGKVKKPDLSATDKRAGDHGPDALVALLAERAARFRSTQEAAA
jgi:hypothetical protein